MTSAQQGSLPPRPLSPLPHPVFPRLPLGCHAAPKQGQDPSRPHSTTEPGLCAPVKLTPRCPQEGQGPSRSCSPSSAGGCAPPGVALGGLSNRYAHSPKHGPSPKAPTWAGSPPTSTPRVVRAPRPPRRASPYSCFLLPATPTHAVNPSPGPRLLLAGPECRPPAPTAEAHDSALLGRWPGAGRGAGACLWSPSTGRPSPAHPSPGKRPRGRAAAKAEDRAPQDSRPEQGDGRAAEGG